MKYYESFLVQLIKRSTKAVLRWQANQKCAHLSACVNNVGCRKVMHTVDAALQHGSMKNRDL